MFQRLWCLATSWAVGVNCVVLRMFVCLKTATVTGSHLGVRSLDDPMNKLPICLPFRCQRHQFWQFHSSPVGDVIKPLSSLPARSTFAGHACSPVSDLSVGMYGVLCDRSIVASETLFFQQAISPDLLVLGPNRWTRVQRMRFSLPFGSTTSQMPLSFPDLS